MWRKEVNIVKQAIKDHPISEFWTRGIEGVDGDRPTHNSELIEDIIKMVRKAGYLLYLVKTKPITGRPPKKKKGGGGSFK